MGAEIGLFATVSMLAAVLGPVQLAAHQVAITLASLSFTAAMGLANAGSVLVGRAVGAGDTARARRAGLLALGVGGVLMTLFGLLFALQPRLLVRIFTEDASVLAMAVPLLVVAAVFQVSDGVQGVATGILRGAGDTRFTFAMNLIGHYGVGLPVAILLGVVAGWGVVGLWWGLCAGLTVVGVGLAWRFLRVSARPIARL